MRAWLSQLRPIHFSIKHSKMSNKIFKYGDNGITFQNNDGTVMVNATEMAKPFSKQPSDWVRLQYTEQFFNVLEAQRGIPRSSMVQSVRGGGTWFHEDVAMEFARWLAPAFGIWCNDRIKELLKTGVTRIDDISKLEYAKMLVEAEEGKEKAQKQLALQQPAADFYDRHVVKSDQLMPVSIIAKEYNTGARAFNKRLKAQKIIYSVGGVWVLCAPYQNLGYAEHKIYETEHRTDRHLYWTEKGFEFLRKKIKA